MKEIQELLQTTTPKITTHKKTRKPYNTSLTHMNTFASVTLWKFFLPQQPITVAAQESLFEKHVSMSPKDFWSTNVLVIMHYPINADFPHKQSSWDRVSTGGKPMWHSKKSTGDQTSQICFSWQLMTCCLCLLLPWCIYLEHHVIAPILKRANEINESF